MNNSTDNVKTKDQLSDDVKLIKEILNTTSTDFGKSYRIFFVIATLFAIYIIGEYLFDMYAISTLSKVITSGDKEDLVLSVSTRILFYYPLVILAVMYFMKRKTIGSVNVSANKLMNLWGLGIGTVLVTQFLMGFRNQYVAINMQDLDAYVCRTVRIRVCACSPLLRYLHNNSKRQSLSGTMYYKWTDI